MKGSKLYSQLVQYIYQMDNTGEDYICMFKVTNTFDQMNPISGGAMSW